MSTSRFSQVSAIFRDAAALEGAKRDEFLCSACGDDDLLRREVEAMLEADVAPPDFLAEEDLRHRAAARAADVMAFDRSARTDRMIGKYRLIDILGTGGMGVVYRAEQVELQRQVALKVIHPLLMAPGLERRMEHEALAQARLQHRGIAQIYETGVQNDDLGSSPFIAMELVLGQPLTDYVRERKLSIRDRLQLMLQVCGAVQHAHHHGIIHRDLKPANILVKHEEGEAPVAKVLDFGIARITDSDVVAVTQQTGTGQLLGTFQYMSPEQARGDPAEVDMRTDVYSIGVILYEMLAERPPLEFNRTSIQETLRKLADDDPTPLDRVDRAFRGDLATIVRTAMAKDKSRRYESAAALAGDLRRYLRDEAIAAHPPSTVYQLRKFTRRHRSLVAAVAAIAVMLVAATIVSSIMAMQAQRANELAQERFNDVHGMANTLLFDLDSKLSDLPGALSARQTLVETGQAYLDRLSRHARTDVMLQIDIAGSYIKLGDVRGDVQRPNLGDYEGAAANYEAAIAMLDPIPAENVLRNRSLFLAYSKLGAVLRHLNRPNEAAAAHRRGLAVAKIRAAALPQNVGAQRDLIIAHERMLKSAGDLGDEELAERHRNRIADLTPQLIQLAPDNPLVRRDIAVARFDTAVGLLGRGDAAAAESAFREYLDLVQTLAEANPHRAVYQRDVAVGHQRLGQSLEAQGRIDEALQAYEENYEIIQTLAEADPANFLAQFGLAAPSCKIGEIHLARGDYHEARRCFDRYLDISRSCLDQTPDSPPVNRDVGVALYKQAEWALSQARDTTRSVSDRETHYQNARDWLTECHEHFTMMRTRGMLGEAELRVPDEIASELADCATELAQLPADHDS